MSISEYKEQTVQFDTMMEELLLQAVALEVATNDKENENTKLVDVQHQECVQNEAFI